MVRDVQSLETQSDGAASFLSICGEMRTALHLLVEANMPH